MNAEALRRAPPDVPALKKVARKQARALKPASPSLKAAMARLDKLTADAIPWFSKDVDLTPPDGGQELIGPLERERIDSARKVATGKAVVAPGRKAAADAHPARKAVNADASTARRLKKLARFE